MFVDVIARVWVGGCRGGSWWRYTVMSLQCLYLSMQVCLHKCVCVCRLGCIFIWELYILS